MSERERSGDHMIRVSRSAYEQLLSARLELQRNLLMIRKANGLPPRSLSLAEVVEDLASRFLLERDRKKRYRTKKARPADEAGAADERAAELADEPLPE